MDGFYTQVEKLRQQYQPSHCAGPQKRTTTDDSYILPEVMLSYERTQRALESCSRFLVRWGERDVVRSRLTNVIQIAYHTSVQVRFHPMICTVCIVHVRERGRQGRAVDSALTATATLGVTWSCQALQRQNLTIMPYQACISNRIIPEVVMDRSSQYVPLQRVGINIGDQVKHFCHAQ